MRLEGEIRVDRFGAIAGERRELMHLVRFARLDNEADGGAQALLDQVVMHGRRREQRRDRDAIRPAVAIRQDDDVVLARAHGLLGFRTHDIERPAHADGALFLRVGDVDGDRVELVVLDRADLADALKILVGQDRLIDFEPLLLRGAFEIEQVRTRADEGDERHDQSLRGSGRSAGSSPARSSA